jgi:hypothetical protein
MLDVEIGCSAASLVVSQSRRLTPNGKCDRNKNRLLASNRQQASSFESHCPTPCAHLALTAGAITA